MELTKLKSDRQQEKQDELIRLKKIRAAQVIDIRKSRPGYHTTITQDQQEQQEYQQQDEPMASTSAIIMIGDEVERRKEFLPLVQEVMGSNLRVLLGIDS